MAGTYFWYMFQRALLSAGIAVYTEDNLNPNLPAVKVVLTGLDSDAYAFRVEITKGLGTTLFVKDYRIQGPPAPAGEPDPGKLESRAYEMAAISVKTIFQDPEFKKVFMRASN